MPSPFLTVEEGVGRYVADARAPGRSRVMDWKTIEDTVGNTPLVRLKRLPGAHDATSSSASSRATIRPAR